MKKLQHLSEIHDLYDAYIIDLWGVMHNGINLHKDAINAVENLKKKKKRVIFLSNAPRPTLNVIKFLKKLKMDEYLLENVLTSGEAAIKSIQEQKYGKNFYHLGPERDNSLFEGLEKNKSGLNNSDFILCTGLFDGKTNDLDFYHNLLKDHFNKKFICTNPDLTVHRGQVAEYCAGTIAQIFEKIGGKVIYFGKPHKEIYDLCLRNNERTLVIGDNLRTDIKGANNLNIDSIFITEGVHRKEIGDVTKLDALLKRYKVKTNFFQKELTW